MNKISDYEVFVLVVMGMENVLREKRDRIACVLISESYFKLVESSNPISEYLDKDNLHIVGYPVKVVPNRSISYNYHFVKDSDRDKNLILNFLGLEVLSD